MRKLIIGVYVIFSMFCFSMEEKEHEFLFSAAKFKYANETAKINLVSEDGVQYISVDDVINILGKMREQSIVTKNNGMKIQFFESHISINFDLKQQKIYFNDKLFEFDEPYFMTYENKQYIPLYLMNIIFLYYETEVLKVQKQSLMQLYFKDNKFIIDCIDNKTQTIKMEKEITEKNKILLIKYLQYLFKEIFRDDKEKNMRIFETLKNVDVKNFYSELLRKTVEINNKHLRFINEMKSNKIKDKNGLSFLGINMLFSDKKLFYENKQIARISGNDIGAFESIEKMSQSSITSKLSKIAEKIMHDILKNPDTINSPKIKLTLYENNGNMSENEIELDKTYLNEYKAIFRYLMYKKNYTHIDNEIDYLYIPTFNTDVLKNGGYQLPEIKENENRKYLIIDIRDNGGGLGETAFSFVRKVSFNENIYAYIKTVDGLSETIVKGENTAKNKYKVIVLMNNDSYSAATLFPVFIRTNNSGILVGEKSGGGVGVPMYLVLPDNGLVFFPTLFKITNKDGDDFEKGIEPDIYIEDKKDDFDFMINEVVKKIKNKEL